MLKDMVLHGDEFDKAMLKSFELNNDIVELDSILKSLDDAVTINEPKLMEMVSPDFDRLLNINIEMYKDIKEIQNTLIDADKRAGNPWENIADQKTVKIFWDPSDELDAIKGK